MGTLVVKTELLIEILGELTNVIIHWGLVESVVSLVGTILSKSAHLMFLEGPPH